MPPREFVTSDSERNKGPKAKTHLPSKNDMDPGVNTYAEGSGLPKNKDKNTKLTAGDSVYVRNPTKPPTR